MLQALPGSYSKTNAGIAAEACHECLGDRHQNFRKSDCIRSCIRSSIESLLRRPLLSNSYPLGIAGGCSTRQHDYYPSLARCGSLHELQVHGLTSYRRHQDNPSPSFDLLLGNCLSQDLAGYLPAHLPRHLRLSAMYHTL